MCRGVPPLWKFIHLELAWLELYRLRACENERAIGDGFMSEDLEGQVLGGKAS